MMSRLSILAVAALTHSCAVVATSTEFEAQQLLHAGNKPVDIQRIGHAAPFIGDFDDDGRDDLLVGEFYKGRMRIYRNVGSQSQPRFDTHEWFQAGGQLGRVPVG